MTNVFKITSSSHMLKQLIVGLAFFCTFAAAINAEVKPESLRTEYLENPVGIDAATPRLSWKLTSEQRNQQQASYRIFVASSAEALERDEADLWDSGKVDSDQSLFIQYAGPPLKSRQECFWKVWAWSNGEDQPTSSEVSSWSMGLMQESDWTASYISFKDESPIHTDVETLNLPAARQYRKDFKAEKKVARATIYSTALGIYELQVNGKRVGDAMFAPGWTDYRQRAYYNTYDVTGMVKAGDNAIGAWVADGWYSGYVGFGLLTGIATEKTGRAIYGKTPSLMAQLEIEYSDGSTETISTDTTWKVTGEGPIQEADLLMGEAYDARNEMPGWATAGFDDSKWDDAIAAEDNGNPKADFYEFQNPQEAGQGVKKVGVERDFGFKRPALEAFPGVPVRIIEDIATTEVTERESGTYMFNLGQNFAGTIRLKIKGEAGRKIQIRYGEMLHPDGRLMTENLRKARATDFYTCKGDPAGETYVPRFTFHGFQYVEVANMAEPASKETVTGLVLHSDTPMVSTFECSDPMVNQLFKNVVWTQRANFLDLPTDCPQRDERMGWTGDAQAYVATAAYNADIGAFYTKWLRELMESQRPSGAFPGYSPFPFQHGWDFGTAWADAGVICPWTIWQFYGDTKVIDDCWEPMAKFMVWRKKTSVGDLGVTHGNAWGDWLAQGAETPLDYVDSIYFAISAKMMAEMAEATGRKDEAVAYRKQFEATRSAFQKKYMRPDGSINVRTQTAQALALFADLIPEELRAGTGKYLADMLEKNGNHMATGFLGTRPLLPVLSDAGQHDLAMFLLQSREFPSWGYEIGNGATTIWERWDSYTKEDAFGRHNAAMNSFSHYAFGAVCEWMFDTVAGIQSGGPGFKKIVIRPVPPNPGSNALHNPIDWVKASYDSIRGNIVSQWKLDGDDFLLTVEIPANTTANVYLPAKLKDGITVNGAPLEQSKYASFVRMEGSAAVIAVPSGKYEFKSAHGMVKASSALKTSKPKDFSMNPDQIDMTNAKLIQSWDFSDAQHGAQWGERKGADVIQRDGKAFVVATANDSQMAARLTQAATGKLVIELKATLKKGATSQFYWAEPGKGFNGTQQTKRRLNGSDVQNSYLFSVTGNRPVMKIRFDPFATYDEYADKGEMEIDSISVYQLPE